VHHFAALCPGFPRKAEIGGAIYEYTPPKNLSRRSLVAGVAALPALVVQAVAASAEPDPIFAAIERHRKATAACLKADEDQVLDYKRFADAMIDAFYRVWDMVPTTLAGMRAKIDFAVALSQFSDADRDFVETFYESARLIAVPVAAE
jgi:hypothetical protein